MGRFEQADGGTLFLDEIGDISADHRPRSCVYCRSTSSSGSEAPGHAFDVRLIAATNRDLPRMVQSGQFREDLYYRLNVVSIEMPPLRERQGRHRCRWRSSSFAASRAS